MKPIDIYRTANLMIRQHSNNASYEALNKMAEFQNEGAYEAANVWLQIAFAISELQESTPSESTIFH